MQQWGFDGELLAGWQTDIGALREMIDSEVPDVEFKEYDESIEDEVEFIECPSCGHKFPK